MADARIRVLARVVTHSPRYDRIEILVLEEHARVGLRDIKYKGIELLRQRAQLRKQLASVENQAKGSASDGAASQDEGSSKDAQSEATATTAIKESERNTNKESSLPQSPVKVAAKPKKRFAIDGTKTIRSSNFNENLNGLEDNAKRLKVDGESVTSTQSIVKRMDTAMTHEDDDVLAMRKSGTESQEDANESTEKTVQQQQQQLGGFESPPQNSGLSNNGTSVTPSVTEGRSQPEPTTAPSVKKRFVIAGGGRTKLSA